MRSLMISLLLLLFSACGKIDCPSSPTTLNNLCGEPYGLLCLNIDQYAASGYDVCGDAQECGIDMIRRPYPCNPGGPRRP